ncbi:MAG: YiiX family permuted papain-like enzyme [Krumholzibacteria bacterium]|nr:YiiX family permuted papain-like enzyme [Candidatus Krumholzibacteria bacterium]
MVLLSGCAVESGYEPANGDIVFQTSRSGQSAAIQAATKSRYSHMGVVYVRDGRPVVFEAVEPVRATPLDQWIARGEGGHFVVKRLANAAEVLTPAALARMQAVGEGFAGRPYDLYFEWTDDRIYCSELVWKIYERGLGVEIGALQSLGDFDLSSPPVREKLRERWAGGPPLDEKVISPAAMFASDLLIEVYRGKALRP